MPEKIRKILERVVEHGADPWAQAFVVAELAQAMLDEEIEHAKALAARPVPPASTAVPHPVGATAPPAPPKV